MGRWRHTAIEDHTHGRRAPPSKSKNAYDDHFVTENSIIYQTLPVLWEEFLSERMQFKSCHFNERCHQDAVFEGICRKHCPSGRWDGRKPDAQRRSLSTKKPQRGWAFRDSPMSRASLLQPVEPDSPQDSPLGRARNRLLWFRLFARRSFFFAKKESLHFSCLKYKDRKLCT